MLSSPWILASRPRTLPAAIVPVLVGTALAESIGSFQLLPALICCAFSVLIQIGTNFANDYYDWKQGADTETRIGPTRAVASGLIAPQTMKRAATATLAVAFAVGLLLMIWGGWWLVAVGVLSVVSAIAYTAQPIALGYRGLGDLFVVGFFGIIAVGFTFYVQAGFFIWYIWPTGMCIGLLANNLLVINNYRDRETDQLAGKRTLIVRLGPAFGEALVLTSIFLAIGLCLGFYLLGDCWLVLVAVPGLYPIYQAWQRMPRALRRSGYGSLLKKASLGLVLFGVLFSLGILFS